MRYRMLSSTGDYSFGSSANNFYVNSPEAVAQAVKTRLALQLGEWFIDITDGTPWQTEILGKGTGGTRDLVLQERILGTPNATEIVGYQSYLNPATRVFSVSMLLNTAYSVNPIAVSYP